MSLCAACSGESESSTLPAPSDAASEAPLDAASESAPDTASESACGAEPGGMGCSPGAAGKACSDVGLKYECVGTTWQCPAGMVPVAECGCMAGPQPSGPPLQPGDACPDASANEAGVQCGSVVCAGAQVCVHPSCGGGWDPGAGYETGPCPDPYCMDIPAGCGGQIDQSCQCMGASNPCQSVSGCQYSAGHIHCMSA